ncbi:MAG: TVP38/TMEM64 family protein [Dehalococcoidia bacterium]|nr:TVP38/TMEM64 family protein [Dehalococcoidia bacterium]
MTDDTEAKLEAMIFQAEETPLLLRKKVVGGIVLAFLLTAVLYVVTTEYFGLSYKIDAEPFQEWVEERGVLAPIVFILVMALSVLFAPVPNAPIYIAAGIVWGPVLGTAYCMAGLTLGSALAFWIARRVGRKHLPRLIGHRMANRLDTLVEDMGGRVVFWSRMIPAVNFDWVSFVAGMTAVPFRVFIIYSFLGMLFPTGLTVVAGDGLGRDPRITLVAGGIWVGVILASAGYFWARRKHLMGEGVRGPDPGAVTPAELGTPAAVVGERPISGADET